ncbi:hypothetical protein ACLOJK_017150, partial [Asimina triloba]
QEDAEAARDISIREHEIENIYSPRIKISLSSPLLLAAAVGKHAFFCLLLYTPHPTPIIRCSRYSNIHFCPPARKFQCNSLKSNRSSVTDYDLYELLGVDGSSDHSQIKKAYRSLQKRCHPDIAGPTGHDMAIILNEAYSILSDPYSRSIYDQEQAKLSEFRGYTGKPVYSTWCGSESEERAVFVDEVKCVGCLKCALFAQKTFAIESMYGRARVVGQWADSEHKIHDAIQACPVDCISIVDRSNLAALEFLMSKQPRGNVRMSIDNTVGARVSNIFVDVNKFQSRFQEMKAKRDSKERDAHMEAKESAMQAIRRLSNWLYWKSPAAASAASPPSQTSHLHLLPLAHKTTHHHPDTERLREAAARRRATQNAGATNRRPANSNYIDEYWRPTLGLPSPALRSESRDDSNSPKTRPNKARGENKANAALKANNYMKWENPLSSKIPVAMALVSAIAVAGHDGSGAPTVGGSLTEHVGGWMALEVVNSFRLQVFLAGLTWYFLGVILVGVVQIFQSLTFSSNDVNNP